MILLECTLPAWIESIGVAVTIPVSVWGIYKLFIKDKNKERKLTALEELAKTQNEVVNELRNQVDQLSRQTGEFQYQSSLMREQNKIFEQQLELQTSIFEHQKGSDAKKSVIEARRIEIENQKRINDIRPFLFSPSSMLGNGNINIELTNRGGSLINLKVVPVKTDIVFMNPIPDGINIDRGGSYRINGKLRSGIGQINYNQFTFEFNLEFMDMDGNKYQQNVQRISSGQYIFSNPTLLK